MPLTPLSTFNDLLSRADSPGTALRSLFALIRQDYPNLKAAGIARMLEMPTSTARRWMKELEDAPVRSFTAGAAGAIKVVPQENHADRFAEWFDAREAPTLLAAEHAFARQFVDVAGSSTWPEDFRSIVEEMLPSVDRCVYRIRKTASISVDDRDDGRRVMEVDRDLNRAHADYGKAFHRLWLQTLRGCVRGGGVSFADYTLVCAYDCRSHSGAYLGSFIFLRSRTRGLASARDRRYLRSVKALLTIGLMHGILVQSVARPLVLNLEERVARVLGRELLTPQESTVLMMLLVESDLHRCAENLSISISTVRSHVQKNLDKTDAPNRHALYVQFLTGKLSLFRADLDGDTDPSSDSASEPD